MKYCGSITTTGHGMADVCGQPVWGPGSALHQCYKCELEQTKEFEVACREWLLGCSCAPKGEPWKCEECTKAFHDRISGLAAE